MINAEQSLAIIFVIAFVTIALRFAPFVIFRSKTPKLVMYLADVLPFAIMGMLVVYCLKGVKLLSGNHGIPEENSVLVVVLLHKWKHNTLLSILVGTLIYMLLIQIVF